jgi:hypothetical protein
MLTLAKRLIIQNRLIQKPQNCFLAAGVSESVFFLNILRNCNKQADIRILLPK